MISIRYFLSISRRILIGKSLLFRNYLISWDLKKARFTNGTGTKERSKAWKEVLANNEHIFETLLNNYM